ncbi:tRNA preQ1(34) S-adenosylmethionine ribosyltransferase-isomerase QueA [Pelagibacterium sp.]|uniref:tRNA preQ1(34) S-adenosylmethionine ribosyltransferase-isomerase QueA n=1 Tax=Pelagibacterium sp. TaxID=1967288 RepID=UPI003A8F6F71
MKVDLFDFDLPEERIALHPVSPRDSAKMLVLEPDGSLLDSVVTDLERLLEAGDVLVVNDTRVIPAELKGTRHRGEFSASVSFNLHKRVDANTWLAFARPAKRLKVGDRVEFGAPSQVCMLEELSATVKAVEDGQVTLAFDFSGAVLDEAIKARGAMPLPPYIGAKRALEERDKSDYQTVYAEHDGAVAAPTAGLHFTPELLDRLERKGVTIEHVTLHVGAGTFLPMKADDTDEHKMHAEWGVVSAPTVERVKAAKAAGGRVVAVGTTSLRLLESAARKTGVLEPFADETDIFITPGFAFKVVDVLMTNFHLPRSTLFMLVSAFSGLETMHNAYKHAIDHSYRFYSYGDSSLLFRADR